MLTLHTQPKPCVTGGKLTMRFTIFDVLVYALVVVIFYIAGTIACGMGLADDMLIGLIAGILAHGIATIINHVQREWHHE